MAQTNHGWINEGDWVGGTTQVDEKFIGFVSWLGEDVMKVWVTQSDRKEIVGTAVEAKLSKVKRLPDSVPSAPEDVHSLIELALMTHDKAWFAELRAKLMAPSPAAEDRPEKRREPDFPRSRL